MDHSCVPIEHGSFCHYKKNRNNRKHCIVEYHEIELSRRFPDAEQRVRGLFPGTVPQDILATSANKWPTWVCHAQFWRDVLLPMGFPAAKVNCPPMIGDTEDPMLDTCTAFLNRSLLDGLDYSKSRT